KLGARLVFFFQAEDGIRGRNVTGVQTCALPICENTEIVWLDTSGDTPIELSRTAVGNEAEAEAAAQFTVPNDITERKTYTVQLVVNGNILQPTHLQQTIKHQTKMKHMSQLRHQLKKNTVKQQLLMK